MYATLDIETTGLNRFKDEITWIGVQLNEDLQDDNPIVYTFDYSKKVDRKEFLTLMAGLKNDKATLVWQNGKFDTLFLKVKMGVNLPISEDVMLMGTAYDLAEKHGLKHMAQKYLNVPDWDIKKKDKLSGNEDVVEPYLRLDLKYTWELFVFFREVMSSTQVKIYKKLLMPAYRAYRDIESNGIYLDMDEYEIVREKYRRIEKEKLDALNKKYAINWNSPQQKQKVLFTPENEDLPVLKVTPAGKPSADASVLKRLANQGHKLPQMILDYTGANTLNKMFLNRWGDDASYDGRIHPSFNLTNVVSGRTSCLAGDTEVCIPSGTKPIKDIKADDLVYSRQSDGRVTLKKVTWAGCTGVRNDIYKIHCAIEGRPEKLTLTATSDHLISLVDRGYMAVQYLGKGDRVNGLYNGMTVTKVEKVSKLIPVYDITVEETHNFYANEVCVHNCNDPNLQQVPRTKDVRALFTAPEGRVFFEADYSQLELRIAAHYAKEPTMLRIYREGGDIHTETARVLTGGREPTKDERSKAKAVNFGFLYGMLAKKFVDYAYDSYGVTFTHSEAEAYRNAFFAKYSRLLPWHKEQEEICEMLGGVSNLFGRFRKLPKIYSSNRWERLDAVRRAINTPVQGTGSDILLGAMIEVHRELSPYGLRVCGTIHDSIVGEFNEEDEEWIVPEIKRIMAHPKIMDVFGVSLDVDLEADVGVGSWGTK